MRRVAEEVFKEKGTKVHYLVGTMIELPRAALIADEIAKEAEFFSFGTNDLTQTTFGFSRDDVNKVLPTYLAEGILKQDPVRRRSIVTVLVNWFASESNVDARPAPILRWESAASTVGIRRRWSSAIQRGWITFLARHSAC